MATTKTTIALEGMEALQRAIVRAPEMAKNHSKDAASRSTFAIYNRMTAHAPRRTGGLILGIRWKAPGLTGSITIDGAPYWRFLEYGTVHMRARPFIRPSTEAESDTFIRRMRDFGDRLERDWSSGSLR
jgi:HK97 gp10 family phage protein